MKLAIYGYGGHAREVAAQIDKEVTFFVDDQYSNNIALPISSFDPEKYNMLVAVANSKDRMDIVNRLPSKTVYFTYIHPSALILCDDIHISEGSFIGANCVLTTNIKVGKHCILNRSVHIGHDCEIGDYFSAMPSVIISGNVNIGNCVYVGTNTSIKEKTNIHNSVIVGMGAVVINHIETSGTFVGVPAKLIK